MNLSRLPRGAWALVPLLLALLYAAAYALLERKPTATDVVPQGAILTHRFRDLARADQSFPWLPAGREGRPADWLGASRNVPGLPGVDRTAPFYWLLLPREGRLDGSMAIFSLADADALRERYEDPTLLDQGHVRHAQHLAIRGRYAGLSSDGDAVRRLGTGGLVPEDLGEDHALAIDVPALVEFALLTPSESPWHEILVGLGYASEKPTARVSADGRVNLEVGAGRVLRIHQSFTRATAWFFEKEGRVRIDLVPAPGRLADRLAAVAKAAGGHAGSTGWKAPEPPPRARAWLYLPSGEARNAFVAALFAAGVDVPDDTTLDGRPGEAGALLAWGEPAPDFPWSWTVGVLTPGGGLPYVEEGPLAEGAAPLTVYDPRAPQRSPKGALLVKRGDLDALAMGPEAQVVLDSAEAATRGSPLALPAPGKDAAPHLVAAFHVDEQRLSRLIGALMQPQGLFAMFKGSGVEGTVTTDGRVLRLVLEK